MEYIGLWLFFSFAVGLLGWGRGIGFWRALLASLFLSPLIGLILTIASKSESAMKREKKMLELQKQQTETLQQINQAAPKSISEEIEKLQNLKDQGVINEGEFLEAKAKLLGNL